MRKGKVFLTMLLSLTLFVGGGLDVYAGWDGFKGYVLHGTSEQGVVRIVRGSGRSSEYWRMILNANGDCPSDVRQHMYDNASCADYYVNDSNPSGGKPGVGDPINYWYETTCSAAASYTDTCQMSTYIEENGRLEFDYHYNGCYISIINVDIDLYRNGVKYADLITDRAGMWDRQGAIDTKNTVGSSYVFTETYGLRDKMVIPSTEAAYRYRSGHFRRENLPEGTYTLRFTCYVEGVHPYEVHSDVCWVYNLDLRNRYDVYLVDIDTYDNSQLTIEVDSNRNIKNSTVDNWLRKKNWFTVTSTSN